MARSAPSATTRNRRPSFEHPDRDGLGRTLRRRARPHARHLNPPPAPRGGLVPHDRHPPGRRLRPRRLRRGSRLSLPVVYLLHGTPGQQADWLSGAQLGRRPQSDDRERHHASTIVVLPNGNTPRSTDTEWGTARPGTSRPGSSTRSSRAFDLQYRNPRSRVPRHRRAEQRRLRSREHRPPESDGVQLGGQLLRYFVGHQATFGSAWRANSPLYTAAGVPAAERMPLYLGAGSTDYTFKADTAQFAATVTALGLAGRRPPDGAGWARLGGLDARDGSRASPCSGSCGVLEPWLTPVSPLQASPAVAAAGSGTARGDL